MPKCPCCGYDTLSEEGGYEICYLCHWEDDPNYYNIIGDDDIVGGANGDYSLGEARQNFKLYYIMYRVPDIDEYFKVYHKVIEIKKEIMKLLNELDVAASKRKRQEIRQLLDLNEKKLDTEKDKVRGKITIRLSRERYQEAITAEALKRLYELP